MDLLFNKSYVVDDKQIANLSLALAKVLRQHREKLGYSKNLLASKAGLAFQTIAFVENAERKPTIETLTRIALAMDTTPSLLVGEAEEASGL